MESIEKIINIPGTHMSNVFGQFDSHLKVIEKALSVDVVVRGESVKVIGSESAVTKAARALEQLSALAQNGNTIDEQKVSYTLALLMEDKEGLVSEIDKELICFTLAGKPIKPKTVGQKEYIDKIRDNMIVFGLGPAGT
ncbi:MAG: PhoH family protein, partial [Lachnospiraceae bacterium]|nr:PhoH family protein [Lachnospiraceae bacterium]